MSAPSAAAAARPAPVEAGARLRATLAEIERVTGAVTLRVDLPTDARWLALPETLGDLAARHAEVAARVGDRRAGAAYVGAWVAQVPAVAVGLPAVLGDVSPHVALDDLHVDPDPGGWFAGIALDVSGVTVGPRAVPDAARRVAALTAPVIEAITAAMPVGRRALWGGLGDRVAATALAVARTTGRDPGRTWEAVERFVEHLDAAIDTRLPRPRPLPVPWSGGTAWFATRATCCLYYRTCPGADPAGEGYCATCPLRREGTAEPRLRATLEPLASDA